MQALDATGVEDGFVYDSVTDSYSAVSGPTSIHAQHGNATSTSVIWETSVFWHWDGDCYGEASWETEYQSCVVTGGCWSAELSGDGEGKKDKKKKKKGEDPPVDPDPAEPAPVPVQEEDPEHNLSETTILGGESQTGRLFWREIIPE